MRIVAGEFRGRRLKAPKSRDVRPTSDRVREALFSILGARVRHARVLDLYAGTGALGLEALSRGAASALFVDIAPPALSLLRENVDACGAGARARIIGGSAVRIARLLAGEGEIFDLVFMDPPYQEGIHSDLPELLTAVTTEGALAVVEHGEGAPEPNMPPPWRPATARRYGSTFISIFEKAPEILEDARGDQPG